MLRSSTGVARWISPLTISLGFGWIAILIVREASTIQEQFQVIHAGWISVSLIIGAIHCLLAAQIFHILASLHGHHPLGFTYAARLLFVGQLLRHLPGRFWGILYVINETRGDFSPVVMLRANFDFMGLTLAFHMLMSLTLYLFFFVGKWVALVCPLLSLGLLTISLRRDWIGHCLSALAHWFPGKLSGATQGIRQTRLVAWSVVCKIMSLFITMCMLYFAAWHAIVWSFPRLEHMNVWLLCAAYSVAWISGYLSLVTPGGVGVREVAFIMLSAELAELPSLALLAVVTRLWQVALEVIFFLLFFFTKSTLAAERTAATDVLMEQD